MSERVEVRRKLVVSVSPEMAMLLEEAELLVLPFLDGERETFCEEFVAMGLAARSAHKVLAELLRALGRDDMSDAAQAIRRELAKLERAGATQDRVMRVLGAGMIAPRLDDGRMVQ